MCPEYGGRISPGYCVMPLSLWCGFDCNDRALATGDNIFWTGAFPIVFEQRAAREKVGKQHGYYVRDPRVYGSEFDRMEKCTFHLRKLEHPKSNYRVPGLWLPVTML